MQARCVNSRIVINGIDAVELLPKHYQALELNVSVKGEKCTARHRTYRDRSPLKQGRVCNQ